MDINRYLQTHNYIPSHPTTWGWYLQNSGTVFPTEQAIHGAVSALQQGLGSLVFFLTMNFDMKLRFKTVERLLSGPFVSCNLKPYYLLRYSFWWYFQILCTDFAVSPFWSLHILAHEHLCNLPYIHMGHPFLCSMFR